MSFMMNPMLGLGLTAFNSLANQGQNAQARSDSLAQLQSALGAASGLSQQGGGQFSFMGQNYATPNIAGAMQNFQTGIGNRIDSNTQDANAWLGNLNNQTNNLYQNRQNDMMHQFDTGAGNLQNAAENRSNAVLGGFDQGASGLMGAAQNRANSVLGNFGAQSGAYQNWLGNATNTLNQNAQGRQNQGMALLQGMGNQAQQNIEQQFNANRGNIGQNLASRGLGNSTVLDSMLTGNERERANATGNLQDQLRQQALGTYSNLSGDVLDTQQQGLGMRNAAAGNALDTGTQLAQGLSGDVLNTQQGLLGQRTGLQQGLTGDFMNTLGQNFQNRMNLSGGLSSDLLNNQVGGMSGLVQNQIGGEAAGLGWNQQAGGNYLNNLTNSANQMQNILTGTSIQYPGNEWLSAANALGQGIGSYAGTQAAQAAQAKANQQSLYGSLIPRIGGGYSTAGGPSFNSMWGI